MSVPKTVERSAPRPEPVPPGRPAARWPWIAGAVLLVLVLAWWLRGSTSGDAKGAKGGKGAARAVPVVVATARTGDMPVTLFGLGTVTAFNTVTVRSRVDGQIVRIGFEEGQFVEQGSLLVEIDPRPFEAALKQAQGQLTRDQAQLEDAEINLRRYRDLLARQFVSKQQVDDQAAMVAQLRGTVTADQGAIDNAKLQLSYARVTAPIGGRVGLRIVDAGNMIHASDTNGLAVITQVQPIAVLFTIPEDQLPPILKKLGAGEKLAVSAYDRAGKTQLADGELVTADNQIDPTTGTVKLKAVFENRDHALFPNQFVNVRVRLDTRTNAVIVPTAAIQRGAEGSFVFVVKPDQTAEVRKVATGITQGVDTSIDSGIAAGEHVVVDGADKLRAGTRVEIHAPDASPRTAAPAA